MRRDSLPTSERSGRAPGSSAGATTLLAVLLLLAITPGQASIACAGVEQAVAAMAQRSAPAARAACAHAVVAPRWDIARSAERIAPPAADAAPAPTAERLREELLDLPPPVR